MRVVISALVAASVFLICEIVAHAEPPRQINFTVPILNQDNKPMRECADDPAPKKDEECKTWQAVTLGMLALRALAVPEQGLAAEASLKRGHLAMRVYKAESLVLTADEIALIKTQIAKAYSPLIVAITFPMLDPATADK